MTGRKRGRLESLARFYAVKPRDIERSRENEVRAEARRLSDAAKQMAAEIREQNAGKAGGRPEWPSWDSMIEARGLLRQEGKQGTQQEVADWLGCDIKTVKRRSSKYGGWPRD